MNTSTKKLVAIALAAVMMSSVVGMVGAQEVRPQAASPTNASATVAFSDQATDGTSVTVDSVNMSEGGFVVIHDDSLLEGDVTGSVIGVSEYLEPGENENVTVTLFDGVPGAEFNQTELTENGTLIAMPHLDTNDNDTYDFVATNGSDDGPYVANGSAVTDSANVTVETEPTDPTDPPANDSATVTFSDQTTDGTSVTVDSVNTSDGGFVVIHDDSLLDGEVIGSVIGVSEYLEPGENENVSVTLFDGVPGAEFNQTELTENETLIAMPHRDTNDNDTYDFVATNGSADGPYVANGSAVTDSADIAVEATQTSGESFVVTDLAAPEAIERGDTLEVTATIENPNDVADTQTVEYRFDGNVSAREEIGLEAGESVNLTTTVNTSELASGAYVHGIYTREDGQPAQIRIVDEIVSFGVSDLSAPESTNVGDEITVSATVSNPNDFGVEQPVQFRFDGDLVETRNVELDGESSTTVQFEVRATGPPGTYIHSVFTNDFGQDAIISVETPADGGDGGDGSDGDDGGDGSDGDNGGDGSDGDDGGDGSDGDDGGDGSDGDDSDDDADGDDGGDGTDGEGSENGTDGEGSENGTDGEGSENGTDGEGDSDGEQPDTPEDG